MNRQEMRDAVRNQADLDADDLPDATVHLFLREAFDRTAGLEKDWPFYEQQWVAASVTDTYTLDSTINDISQVVVPNVGPITNMNSDLAASTGFVGVEGTPEYFTLWGNTLTLLPTSSTSVNLTIRGWRKPTYDWLEDDVTEADIDERLHIPIYHFAVALAYAQQEDPQLEAVYMNRWINGVSVFRDEMMKPRAMVRPLVFNGGGGADLAASPYMRTSWGG